MATGETLPPQRCAQCRGTLLWDAAVGYLHCQRCGALQQVDEEGLVSEHALAAALAEHKVRSPIGSGSRCVVCGDCAAEVELPDEVQATRCEFCGSPLLVHREAGADHYQPESLVPFAIDRKSAERHFQTWLRKLWLRPRNLRHAASLHELHGIYIPYWAFSCDVTSSWSADAGYTDQAATADRPRRTRWEPCGGQRHDRVDSQLICASRGLASELGGPAQHFDVSGLLPYAPEYLLGFSAERYAVDLRSGWQQARHAIAAAQERRCARDVPGDSQRSLRASHKFESVRFRHVLLPMWIAAYRYQGQLYRFIVNGQSGAVSGRAPHSELKIALLVAAGLGLLATLYFLLSGQQPLPPLPPI